jgi:hypothetical protein
MKPQASDLGECRLFARFRSSVDPRCGSRLLHCGILIWPMSALGHKRTKRHHGAMSALTPKADKELECAPGAGQFEVSDLTG